MTQSQSPGIDANTFKSLSRRLHRQLAKRDPAQPLTLSILQEEIARALGHKNLHAAQAAFNNPGQATRKIVPAPLRDPEELDHAAVSERAAVENARISHLHRAAPELGELFAHAHKVIEQTRDQVLGPDHPFRAWAQEHRFDIARMADGHPSQNFRNYYKLLSWAVMANSCVADVLRELGDDLTRDDVEAMFETLTDHRLNGYREQDFALDEHTRISLERLMLAVRPRDMAYTLNQCMGLVSERAVQQAFDTSLAHLVAKRGQVDLEKQEGSASILIWALSHDTPEGRRTRGTTLFKTLLPEEIRRPQDLSELLSEWVKEGDVASFELIDRVLVDHHPHVAEHIPGQGKTQRRWMEASVNHPSTFRRMCLGAERSDKEELLAMCLAQGKEENAQWLMTHGTRLTTPEAVCLGLHQALARYRSEGLDGVLAALARVEMGKADTLTWAAVLTTGPNKVPDHKPLTRTYSRGERQGNSTMSLALRTIRRVDEFAVVFDWLAQRGARMPHEEIHDLIEQAQSTTRKTQNPEAMLWVMDTFGLESFTPYQQEKSVGALLASGTAPAKALGDLMAAIAPQNKDFVERVLHAVRTVEQAQVLLGLGAKLDAKVAIQWMVGEQHEPQGDGVRCQRRELLDWALGQGLDVNGVANPESGMTLLHVAARLGARALPLAEVLLAHGANPQARDVRGDTPLDMSEHNGFFRKLLEGQSTGGAGVRKPRRP